MFRIDHATAAPALPTPAAPGTPGYFTPGSAPTTPPTIVTADWANAVQEEILAAVEGEGLVADKTVQDQLYQAILRAAGRAAVGNRLINPEFRVWQRFPGGAGPAFAETEGFWGPDRWRFKAGTAGSVGDVDRTNVVFGGAPSSPSGSIYALLWNVSTAAGSAEMAQRIEEVQTLHGQPVVVAFDAQTKSPSADATIEKVELIQRFGTAGSPDVTTQLSPTAGLLIDSSFRRLVFVGTLPSVAGKTFSAGPTSDSNLELRITLDAGQVFAIILTGFVLSRGSADPGYTPRPFGQELRLCQRYFERSSAESQSFDEDTAQIGYHDTALGGIVESVGTKYQVEKYRGDGNPVVTWYGGNSATTPDVISEKTSAVTESDHAVTATAGNASHTGFPDLDTPPASGTLRLFRANWTAEAEIP
jgi:hypothetical protein